MESFRRHSKQAGVSAATNLVGDDGWFGRVSELVRSG